MDIKDYPLRADAEYLAEQAYLRGRVQQIEKSLGKVAAKLAPGELSQPMDALDRARELSNQLEKQVRVQSLESAIASHKAWLDRARANQARAASSGEPWRRTGSIPKIDRCTAEQPFIAAPEAAISSSITDASAMPCPPPPYCSGMAMPTQPPSASAA